MTLQQLEYVVALDSYRHFVTAASKCFVTQPTLTMQVKKLEDEIGILLFNRKKTPLEPTKMGEKVILKARQILREANQLKEMVNQETDPGLLEGTFRIGVIPTIAPYLLPGFLNKFLENHPRVSLTIEEMKSSDIIEKLKSDQLDLGLLVTPLEESQLREIPLYYEPFLVFASKAHQLLKEKKITPEHVQNAKGLLLLNQGHCFRNQVLNICDSNSSKSSENTSGLSYESGSIETIKNLISADAGEKFSLVPELAINSDVEAAYFRKFTQPEPVREVSIVVHNSFTKEILIEQLRNEILNKVPKTFQTGKRFIKVKWR